MCFENAWSYQHVTQKISVARKVKTTIESASMNNSQLLLLLQNWFQWTCETCHEDGTRTNQIWTVLDSREVIGSTHSHIIEWLDWKGQFVQYLHWIELWVYSKSRVVCFKCKISVCFRMQWKKIALNSKKNENIP